MNRIIFLTIFFLNLFLNPLLSEEPPSKLSPCDPSLKNEKWNNCYKQVIYGDGFQYLGEWKKGKFHGYGKLITAGGFVEEGEWVEGKLKWQRDYYYNEFLPGIWEANMGDINEKIFFYDQWIGFKNINHVCRLLATQPTLINNKNSKKYGVTRSTFVVLLTNCKDNKFRKSFDNIFVTNNGELTFFQRKNVSENEETNPVMNPTFPNQYFYDSFEKENIDFVIIKKTKENLTKEKFFKEFGHKFQR